MDPVIVSEFSSGERMTPTTIAIDPARTTGVAVWTGRRLAFSAALELPPTFRSTLDALREIVEPYDVRDCVLVCEEQILGGRNPASMCSVVESRVRWQCAAEALSIVQRLPVYPSTWQARFGCAKGKRDARKRRLLVAASRLVGHAIENEDRADAILLGWYIHERRIEA